VALPLPMDVFWDWFLAVADGAGESDLFREPSVPPYLLVEATVCFVGFSLFAAIFSGCPGTNWYP
jgi:hypothetical protein